MVNNPAGVNAQNIGELKELIELYPYFQTVHLLFLKGLHNSSDNKFANSLITSAVHAADREVLYNLLNKTSVTIPAEENVPEIADEIVIELDSTDPQTEEYIIVGEETGISTSGSDLLSFEYESTPVPEAIVANIEVKEANVENISQSELIDKFILANPRIEPIRDKAELVISDISKPLHEEKETFVTETLAKIYINQEYYTRAIDIYESLSLKFPEKSTYFATQIEKIKELIKQK